MLYPDRTTATSVDLEDLVHELLDAHLDTVQLASELEPVPAWRAHLNYLRDLHRVGQEALANGLRHGARRPSEWRPGTS